MAGLSHSEIEDILKLLVRLNERGITIILIEHIMSAVMSFSQRLVVLVSGKKIADGKPDEVVRDRSGEGLPWSIASPSAASTPPTARCACSRTCRSTVNGGETVVLLGTNGNGKSTLMKCIMGIVRPTAGRIVVRDRRRAARPGRTHHRRDRRPRHRAGAGGPPAVSQADGRGKPAARRVPPEGARGDQAQSRLLLRDVPALAERRPQLAGRMSGGEQQMLALARALMWRRAFCWSTSRRSASRRSWSAAPSTPSRSSRTIQLTVLMAEQNFPQAIRIADRGYVIVHGKIAFEGKSADELNNNDLIRKFYLGM